MAVAVAGKWALIQGMAGVHLEGHMRIVTPSETARVGKEGSQALPGWVTCGYSGERPEGLQPLVCQDQP